jgi:hypothetical protein
VSDETGGAAGEPTTGDVVIARGQLAPPLHPEYVTVECGWPIVPGHDIWPADRYVVVARAERAAAEALAAAVETVLAGVEPQLRHNREFGLAYFSGAQESVLRDALDAYRAAAWPGEETTDGR